MCRHSIVGAVLLPIAICVLIAIYIYFSIDVVGSQVEEDEEMVEVIGIYGLSGLFFIASGVYVIRFRGTYNELLDDNYQ